MSDVPTTSIWADIGSFLLGTVEDVCDVSIVGPDPIAITPLPAALGGTSDDATALVATAVAPDAFLELLRAKAQYLLLPDHLIGQLRDASVVVMFAGVGMTGAPVATSTAVQLGAEMPAYLAALGGDLGRQQSNTDPGPLGALYGELCRVWLQLVAAGDPTWQQLRADGINQFQGASTAQGPASADAAWVAAAVGYVSVRVTEWLRLLTQLSNAQLAAGSTPPDQLAQQVDDACDRYDKAFEVTVFGRVENSPLLQPPLPGDLRVALEENLLGLKALTCHFANTALLGVPASIKEGAVGVFNPQVKRLIAATVFAESFLNVPIAQGVMKQEQQIIWIY